jgi:hypothetical protein
MPDPKPIPDWRLERFAAGALSDAARHEVQRALDGNPAERARLAALREDNRSTLLSHPAPEVLREVERRLEIAGRARPAPRPSWLAIPAAAMAATAVVALFALRAEDRPPGPGALGRTSLLGDDERVKGCSELHIFRIRGQSQDRLLDGAAAGAGDKLQLHYLSGGRRFGVIVSIDGAGGATLHMPEDPRGSSEIPAQNGSPPHGYQLDAAPRFERFFFATSNSPLSAAAVLASARAVAQGPDPVRAQLPLPEGTQQVSLTLNKVHR